MKKLLFFLPGISLCHFSLSQITYQSSHYAVPGDSFLISVSPESALPAYNFDTTGQNFFWQFDTLDAVTQQYRATENPDATGYLNSFLLGIPYVIPGCIEQCTDAGGGLISCTNGCNAEWNQLTNAVLTWDTINLQTIKIYDLYNFFTNTGNAYEKRLIGYRVNVSGITSPLTTALNSPDIIYQFPLAYTNKDSCESDYEIDLGLPFVYKHWQKRVNEVDGWGTLKTPFGTFSNTLRIKSSIHNVDKFYFDTGDSLDLSSILPDSTVEYKWFDLNYGVPVLAVTAKIINGEQINIKAEYLDSLRCLHPVPLFGYLPLPTYLDLSNDSVNVNFYSLAANCDSLRWNFGDTASGAVNFSNLSHPSHWYTQQGVYVVELIGCNASPECDSLICDTFKLPVAVIDTTSIYADFVVKPRFPCDGDTVHFTNISANDTAWFWNFGDGTTDTVENPFHSYSAGGTYEVLLVAMNGFQTDTAYKTVVIETTPAADFAYSDTLIHIPVQFLNGSSGVDSTSSYLWTFGGGNPDVHFSSLENPEVVFSVPGKASICLLTINSLGCSHAVCDTLTVYECLHAKFKTGGISASFCVNATISLINQTATDLNNTVSYQWYKDGVLFSGNENPSVSFSTEGEHMLMLVADNGICTDTMEKQISIKSPAVLYSAGNDTSICPGDSILLTPFYTTGGQVGASVNWSPASGLSAVNIAQPYAAPDSTVSYIFTVNVIGGACNAFFSEKDTVIITVMDSDAVADFTYSLSGLDVSFQDLSIPTGKIVGWQWNFGDGTPLETQQNPVHTYSSPGWYNVTLLVQSACGFLSDTTIIASVIIDGLKETSAYRSFKIFPNPHHGKTSLLYTLKERSEVQIELYNSLGKKVSAILDAVQEAGNYEVSLKEAWLKNAPGTYFLHLQINKQQFTLPLIYKD